jgi:hypothetical protein
MNTCIVDIESILVSLRTKQNSGISVHSYTVRKQKSPNIFLHSITNCDIRHLQSFKTYYQWFYFVLNL